MSDVTILCRNYTDDRVIPRFARYLSDGLGWEVVTKYKKPRGVLYLSGYFEAQITRPWPDDVPIMAYFTHLEEQPPGNGKAKLFNAIAKRVDLRIATAEMYANHLLDFGNTIQIRPPVERSKFTIPKKNKSKCLVCGFSGYSYSNGRKGEILAKKLVQSPVGQKVEWHASGRGWPVLTKRLPWSDMPRFYQSLDILVCTSLVEGIPMPPLEVLSCGGSVVVPIGVGLFDELPDVLGIHRYKKGDVKSLIKIFGDAVKARGDVSKKALRAVTEPYNVLDWCQEHKTIVGELFNVQ